MKILKRVFRNLKNNKEKRYVAENQRSDDFYLTSFPKSGNTWLVFLISNVIINHLKLDMKVNFFNLHNFIPDIHISRKINTNLDYFPFRRIIKSHRKYNPYYNNVILLIRHPKDVMLSYYHYLKNSNRYTGNFDSFVKDKKLGMPAWFEHTRSWLNKGYSSKKLMIVSFDELKNDTFNTLKRIVENIGVVISDETIEKSIKNADFKNMKIIEEQTNTYYVNKFQDFNFVRSGGSAQKDNIITKSTEKYILRKLEILQQELKINLFDK